MSEDSERIDHWARSLVRAVWTATAMLVAAAFALGTYMSSMRSEVIRIGDTVQDLKASIERLPPEWVRRSLERLQGQTVKHEDRIDRLEQKHGTDGR